MDQPERPGGATARRDIHFFWLLDGSGSMQGKKIQSLNFAVAQAVPAMRSTVAGRHDVRVLVHALRFADDVNWISQNGVPSRTALDPIPLSEFQWGDFIQADGRTAMGKALSLVADELGKLDRPNARYFPPVLILVTDGHATDEFKDGLELLMAKKLGKQATRLAVAIGDEVKMDHLKEFIGNDRIPVIEAADADMLADQIVLASTSGIELSSRPASRPANEDWIRP